MKYLFTRLSIFRKSTLILIVGSLILTVNAEPAIADQDQSCLVCHRDAGLKRLLVTGELSSLYVNPEEWQTDVHHNQGIKCIDCHEGMTPFSHPKEGAVKVGCGRCHPEALEQNQLNIHNAFAGVTDKSLPQCYDCHSKHSVKTKEDRDSGVHPKNIGRTCYSCHQELRPKVLMNFLPTRVILGHRKCDVNDNSDLSLCLNCHAGAGHGPLAGYAEYCNRCHDTRKKPGLFSRTHPASSSGVWPLGFFMDNMSLGLNLILIVGFLFIFMFYTIRFHKIRKK